MVKPHIKKRKWVNSQMKRIHKSYRKEHGHGMSVEDSRDLFSSLWNEAHTKFG